MTDEINCLNRNASCYYRRCHNCIHKLIGEPQTDVSSAGLAGSIAGSLSAEENSFLQKMYRGQDIDIYGNAETCRALMMKGFVRQKVIWNGYTVGLTDRGMNYVFHKQ